MRTTTNSSQKRTVKNVVVLLRVICGSGTGSSDCHPKQTLSATAARESSAGWSASNSSTTKHTQHCMIIELVQSQTKHAVFNLDWNVSTQKWYLSQNSPTVTRHMRPTSSKKELLIVNGKQHGNAAKKGYRSIPTASATKAVLGAYQEQETQLNLILYVSPYTVHVHQELRIEH